MYCYTHKFKIAAVLMSILAGACLLMLAPSVCFADNSMAIKDITKPSSFDSGEMDLENIEDRIYRARGTLDAKNDKAVVVNDVLYLLASDARIRCSIGSYVGIRVNEYGQVISCEHLGRSPR